MMMIIIIIIIIIVVIIYCNLSIKLTDGKHITQ